MLHWESDGEEHVGDDRGGGGVALPSLGDDGSPGQRVRDRDEEDESVEKTVPASDREELLECLLSVLESPLEALLKSDRAGEVVTE